MTSSAWIILTGAVVASSCAVLGSFLVLRRLSMLGDAISHAVLPGIVVAFLVTHSFSSWPMFLGAVAMGVITTFVVQYLSQRGIEGNAAIGVTFTSLFAIGVVLVSSQVGNVHLDLECVLYGEIAYTPFDTLFVGGAAIGPRPLWVNAVILLINLLVVGLFYKQFKLCAFDPGMAAAVGINVSLMHYLLMSLVSVTTVGAFESVGAIIVVAMFIVPGATAYLLTDRLSHMLAIAVTHGVVSSIVGYYIASLLDCSIAGAMASVGGVFFLLAALFSPAHGVLMRALARWSLRRRLLEEDLLLWAWRRVEPAGVAGFTTADAAAESSWSLLSIRGALRRLIRSGMLAARNGVLELTDHGRDRTAELIRRHRLYESYLHELGYPEDHLHDPADRVEHHISETAARALAAATGDPDYDPQHKPIPKPEG